MKPGIVKSMEIEKWCIIISGGPELDQETLLQNSKAGDVFIICADHGYDHAKALGIEPDLLLGDFDSMQAVRQGVGAETLVYPCEKDDTDTVAAVKEALRRGFTHVELHGCTGGRLDHYLGNVACLLYLHHRNAKGILYAPWGTVQVVEGTHVLTHMKGRTVSILPAEGSAQGVTLTGFHYPLHEATLTAEYPVGISNVVEADKAVICVRTGTLLLIINDRI